MSSTGKRSRTTSKSRSQRLLLALAVGGAFALPVTSASAQGETKDCPPGSWFCGETTPPPVGANKDLQPLPAEKTPPPPVVVYQPPPTTDSAEVAIIEIAALSQRAFNA